jgi:hypothetical protein
MSTASKILMGSGAVDVPVDDEFDNVSFLSHFDGANNGTNSVYDDGSTGNHTMSVSNNPTQGTFSPFSRPDGEWSAHFNNRDDEGDWIDISSSSDFAYGTGDFTWECFFFLAAPIVTSNYIIDQGSSYDPALSIQSDGHLNWKDHSSGVDVEIDIATNVTVGVWHHVAISRASGTVSFYYDGTRTGTTTTSSDFPAGAIRIGNYSGGGSYMFKGFLSNVRIVTGTAVYSGTSITVPTSALTSTGSDTKLLTCQSNRLIDNSASAHTLTTHDFPKVSAFTPILTSEVYDSAVNGASAYFDDATVKTIHTGTSADWTWGDDPWTMEAWIYPTDVDANYDCITANYAAGMIYARYNSGTGTHIIYFIGVSGAVYGEGPATPLNAYTWNHIALVRNGTSYKAYVNGVAGATLTYTHTHGTASAGPVIGAYSTSGTEPFPGYITDVRYLKGTALYSSNFTPPTAPLTAIDDTVLLLNMADGQALDSAAQNNLMLYGNADTSTTQYKFGTSSLALDGTSDYLDIPGNSAFAFSTGNFTVEAFIYTSDHSTDTYYRRIYMTDGPTGNNDANPQLAITDGGKVNAWSNSGSLNIIGTTTVSDGAWHHVAMVRSSGTVSLYIDGTSEGTPASYTENVNLNSGSPRLRIGSYNTALGDFNGYIDEVRVSKMARYTSNFPTPTKAFPDKGQ